MDRRASLSADTSTVLKLFLLFLKPRLATNLSHATFCCRRKVISIVITILFYTPWSYRSLLWCAGDVARPLGTFLHEGFAYTICRRGRDVYPGLEKHDRRIQFIRP